MLGVLEMANFLFWNINGNDLSRVVAELCEEKDVDVLVLAEATPHQAAILVNLNSICSRRYSYPPNLSPRLLFFTRFPHDSFESTYDTNTLAIRHVKHPMGVRFNLAGVHLPSKLGYESTEQAMFSTRVSSEILDNLNGSAHYPTIVIGDFNMNPFELGLVSSEGFHAVMDRRVARKVARVVQGAERQFFYNPMWGIMGDTSDGPPGTYYYPGSTPVTYFWNTYDQVLVSHDLVDDIPADGIHVIDEFLDYQLRSPDGTPNAEQFSDHFPLFCKIELERRVLE